MKSFRIVFACGTPDAAESLRLGECSVETLQPRVRSPAFLDIISLATCFLGFLGLIFVVWRMKTGVFGTPRALYLFFIGMACAPFYVAFLRPPKIPFLFPPVIAIFLLYPIAAPHGIVYSTDPIFNFSFTQDLLRTGFWDPGGGNAFAKTYSFYPIGNVFVGYVVLNAPLPAAVSCSTSGPPRSCSTTRSSKASARSSSHSRCSPCSCSSRPSTPPLNDARCSSLLSSVQES